MLFDDICQVTMTGTILKTEVREIRKQFILVIRVACNRSYNINGVVKKSSTVVECQKWSDNDPKNQAIFLTKGTRISIYGDLKENNYQTKDGRYHKSLIMKFKNFFILRKSPYDLEHEEEAPKEEDYYSDFEDEDSIYDNPLF